MELIGPTSQMPVAPDIIVAEACRHCGTTLHAGDVCTRGDEAGSIVACCADASGNYAIVDKLKLVSMVSQHSRCCNPMEATREIWAVDEV